MIHAPSLLALPGIAHAFFTREGGVSEGVYASLNAGLGSSDDPANVLENRARMATMLGVAPGNLVTAYQVHSTNVMVAETPWAPGEAPRCDAIVTRMPGLAVGAASADCGPILFADAEAGVIGAAHAGWRGALTGILESTLATMETLGAELRDIHVALGPMISQANYEIGADFLDSFLEADESYARFFVPANRPNHAMFDLPGFIVHRLEQAGVRHIENLGLCTYADPARFFSYRRMTHLGEADYGRHISAIALV